MRRPETGREKLRRWRKDWRKAQGRHSRWTEEGKGDMVRIVGPDGREALASLREHIQGFRATITL